MTRTGRHHWCRGLVAVVMVALVLGAGLLVSAGSAHHAAAAAPGAVAVNGLAALAPADHDHRRGNDWTPSPGPRLRPAAGVSVVCAVPIGATGTGRPLVNPVGLPLSASSDDGLALLGVLRI